MAPSIPNLAPSRGRIRLFIEVLVLVVAETTVLLQAGARHSSVAHVVGASLLIALFSVLGLPGLRRRLPPVRAALLDLGILSALGLVGTEISALTFIAIASGLRNGSSFSTGWWLVFASANVAAVVLSGLVAVVHQHGVNPPIKVLETGAYAIVALALMHAAICYANSASSAYEALSAAHEELRRYAERVGELAALRERQRIALDLHDALGHELTSQAMQIEAARSVLDADHPAATYLSRAHGMALQGLASVRRSVRDISRDPLERESLAVALRRLCARFGGTSGLPVALEIVDIPLLPASATTHALNIAREALTNIGRHANARRIIVRARGDANRLVLTVEDDGRGFDVRANAIGHGLRGMRSRAEAVGGALDVRTSPGAGCMVTLDVPLTRGALAQ